MLKKILCVIAAVAILGLTGCDLVSKATETTTTVPASVTKIREAEIGKVWKLRQMEIDLKTAVSIVLTLKDGDKVDGYFYLVKGDSVGFKITGTSLIYVSQPPDATTTAITSDRFSFTAAQGQGTAYTLTFSPAGKDAGMTLFLELVYPTTGSLFVPFGTK
jgi:hypothetical protein